MTVLYADLSHHDWDRVKGEFDWAAVKRATSPVLCLRATYGDPAGYNPTSRHFADMALGARRAGFDVIGGYHNLIKGDQASINRQVDYLRRELDRVGATWAMLDVERYPELVSNGLWPRFDDVQQFVARWRAVDRRVLAIYLPRWIWDGHMGRPDLRQLRCPLVASDYGTNPDGGPTGVYSTRGGDTGRGWTAYGGATPSMWQFGSNINCPGASGQTDVNAYRGTLTQLRAFLTTQEEDMPLTADEIDQIADAVWERTKWVGNDGKTAYSAGSWLRNANVQSARAMTAAEALGGVPAQLATLAGRVDLSADEVQAVAAALAPAIVAQLPEGPIDDSQLERVLRKVLGSVDGATPQG